MTNKIINGQLVCVALNDQAHVAAMQTAFNEVPHKQAPTQPVLYFKPRNTFNESGAKVAWPTHGDEFVVGASIGVVIGKTCCRVSEQDALNFVQGYTLVHDFSLPEQSYYRPDIKGKCLDGSAPVGGCIVDKAQVTNLAELTVTTSVNGQSVSELPVANLARSPEQLISIISRIMTLQPGDIIAVGFPAERSPVQAGDNVSSTLSDLVTLNNTVGVAN